LGLKNVTFISKLLSNRREVFTIKRGGKKMRIIIKLSGEALGGDGPGINDEIANRFADEIIEIKNRGVETCVVIGGGNFWRGRSANPNFNRARADEIGMIATAMNGLYLAETFRTKGAGAKVVTPFAISNWTAVFNREAALEDLSNGKILVFAGGTVHPFFSTDSIAALRGAELRADLILFAKNVDGVYDSDPKINPNAKRYDSITYKEIIEKNLTAIDVAAAVLCNDCGILSYVFDASRKNSIIEAVDNYNSNNGAILTALL
jgi:uridylate kinase